ncbi:penicillin-binding protein 1A [Candidatus Saganbacteria bacterium]|nr:penicillin-binding protein 1A [Candidatus Saganbacteria bacterium]
MNQKKTPKKRPRSLLIVILIIAAAIVGIFVQTMLTLPKVETLDYYIPSESTTLFSSDSNPMARFHKEENRRVVQMSSISPYIKKAVISIEDERFYSHNGVDFQGILRAAGKNLLCGRIVEGGSTITQQLARNLFLTRQKSIVRKFAEIIIALQIEHRFTKQEILEYYLNQIYFGHNAYGIESASDLYFDKHAKDLTLAEASMLAGIIEGPELFSPYKNMKLAKGRQKLVLAKMVDLGLTSLTEAQNAFQEILPIYPENLRKFGNMAPYFVDYILQLLTEKYGEEMVNKGGLRVYTTLDPNMQIAAEEAVKRFAEGEGPKYNFSQASLIAIDPRSGHIKAMVGGVDFVKSQFNRAVQAKRQPGSSFKPFIYAAAIEKGISPGTVIEDKPISFKVYRNKWNPRGSWSPKNFDKKFHGNVTLQTALEKSLNIPAIQLLQDIGVSAAISIAQRMGITSRLEPALSLALGASEVTLYEMTSAFGVFANNGVRFEPVAITKIVDRNGNVIFQHEARGKRVLSDNVAAVMDEMMEGVILRGTGVAGNIGRPAAAKTGTSQDFRDAWFVGFTPHLVCGVWVGNDNNAHMKGVAEVAVCPRLWREFMSKAMGVYPAVDFQKPQGLVAVKICLSSGLLPNSSCPKDKIVSAKYFEKDIPIAECYIHPTEKDAVEEKEDEPEGSSDEQLKETEGIPTDGIN